MRKVRYFNAPAFGPYLPICLFYETVAWFQEIFMSHSLSHRWTLMLKVNTSTSATPSILSHSFRCCDVFSLALTSMQAETSLPAFFCSSFHSNPWMTTHGWVLVKNAAWLEWKTPPYRLKRCIPWNRPLKGVNCGDNINTKSQMTSSSELRTNLFLHSSIISPRDGDYGLGFITTGSTVYYDIVLKIVRVRLFMVSSFLAFLLVNTTMAINHATMHTILICE